MQVKRFVIDTVDGGRSVLTENGVELGLHETCDLLNEFHEENQELKKQLGREETDKKRLMSYLMRYKGFGFDEIVEDFLDEAYHDKWWEDGFYESCWDEYLKEKGFED